MKLNLLFESESKIYYHATSIDRLNSIMIKGLIPSPSRANNTPLGDNYYLSKDLSYANYMGSEYYIKNIDGKLIYILVEVPEEVLPTAYLDEGYLGLAIDQILNDPKIDQTLKSTAYQILKFAERYNQPLGTDLINQEFLKKISPLIDKIPTLKNQINQRFRDPIDPEKLSAIYAVGFEEEGDEDYPKVLKIFAGNNPRFKVGDVVR